MTGVGRRVAAGPALFSPMSPPGSSPVLVVLTLLTLLLAPPEPPAPWPTSAFPVVLPLPPDEQAMTGSQSAASTAQQRVAK